MSYFDATDAAYSLALLPTALRQATDLALIAAESERDVLAVYTKRLTPTTYAPTMPVTPTGLSAWGSAPVADDVEHPYLDLGDGRGVFLRGYTVDPDDSTSDDFVEAFRQTVARVIVWRIYQAQRDLPATSQSEGGGKSRSWRPGHDGPFPTDWDRDLRVFDTRIPGWGL